MEEHYKNEVDNWLCNLYFEIDKIRLSEIKIDKESKQLYHRVHNKKENKANDTTGVNSERGAESKNNKIGDQIYR